LRRRIDAGQGGQGRLGIVLGMGRHGSGQITEIIMAPKILCPVDGSDHALHAVDMAAEVTLKYGGELLLCVINVAHGGGRGPIILHWTDPDAQAILDRASAAAVAKGVKPADTAIVTDREAASGIVRFADLNQVNHIVMGTGDRRGLSRLVLGSVAADVAARAHCTVTIAR
jgi:nucleotide-binding universal stress UspA family protein